MSVSNFFPCGVYLTKHNGNDLTVLCNVVYTMRSAFQQNSKGNVLCTAQNLNTSLHISVFPTLVTVHSCPGLNDSEQGTVVIFGDQWR